MHLSIDVAKLTKRQLKMFERMLVEQLSELFSGVQAELRDQMVRHLFEQDEPRDEGDESLRVQLRDARVSLAENEARRAQEIEAALRRMQEGTYGMCVECDQQIELERLKLVPWAARCIDDQTELERRMREHAPTL